MPVIATPDVEMWATGWLRGVLAGRSESYASGVLVSNAVPSTRRDRMVIVRRDGGPRSDLLYSEARVSVNVWAQSESDATNLAALVEALLLSVRAVPPVLMVRSQSGPSPIPDAQPRRLFVVEITVRGAEV